jgi:putative transposase
MSWVRIWVHLVFTTYKSKPFFNSSEIRNVIFNHITENAKEKNIWMDSVGGYKQHVHCLISLGKDQTISGVLQLIKGESSFWINKNKIVQGKFAWQDDYWAVSVSESHLEQVRKYIQNQEEHHRTKSFDEEMDEFMKKYGWNYIKEKE